MKVDNRIIDKLKIFTPINTDGASEYIGEEGFFTDDYKRLGDVTKLTRSKLYDVHEDQTGLVYTTSGSDGVWKFFIPLSNIKLKEKNYRPFRTLEELRGCGITLGSAITIRNDTYPEVALSVLVTEINYNPENNELIDITLGATGYEFDILWESYSILKDNINWWVPFGFEE